MQVNRNQFNDEKHRTHATHPPKTFSRLLLKMCFTQNPPRVINMHIILNFQLKTRKFKLGGEKTKSLINWFISVNLLSRHLISFLHCKSFRDQIKSVRPTCTSKCNSFRPWAISIPSLPRRQ